MERSVLVNGLLSSRNLYFAVGLLLIAGTAAFIGAVHTKIFGHDIFFLLDNGWRAVQGQRPHIDYVSAFGPVTFLVAAAGLTLSDYTVDGIGYGNALFCIAVGLWCFVLGRQRLGTATRLALSWFLAALAASPYPLGLSPFDSSHAMVYNRYGYSLLGLILLEILKPARGAFLMGTDWIGGLSTGAALSLTLFLKASYFVIGAPLVIASLILIRLSRQRLTGVLTGFGVLSLCLLGYLRFDASAMMRDLQMAAEARSQSLHVSDLVWHALEHSSAFLAVLLMAINASLSLHTGLRLPLIGVVLFAGDICLLSANAQGNALPLIGIFGLLVANDLWEQEHRPALRQLGASLSLCGLLFVPQFASDVTGLAYGALRKVRPAAPARAAHFTSSPLRNLLLYDGEPPRSNGQAFASYVNDGAALLERTTTAGETVLTMDMTNPFPYALGRLPPRGGIAAATYRITLSDNDRPSDEQYFGDADIVMVPKHPAQDDRVWDPFYRLYQPGLERRFRLAAETEWWQLYRRK